MHTLAACRRVAAEKATRSVTLLRRLDRLPHGFERRISGGPALGGGQWGGIVVDPHRRRELRNQWIPWRYGVRLAADDDDSAAVLDDTKQDFGNDLRNADFDGRESCAQAECDEPGIDLGDDVRHLRKRRMKREVPIRRRRLVELDRQRADRWLPLRAVAARGVVVRPPGRWIRLARGTAGAAGGQVEALMHRVLFAGHVGNRLRDAGSQAVRIRIRVSGEELAVRADVVDTPLAVVRRV